MNASAGAALKDAETIRLANDPRRRAGTQALMTDRIPSAAFSHEATVDDSGPLPSWVHAVHAGLTQVETCWRLNAKMISELRLADACI